MHARLKNNTSVLGWSGVDRDKKNRGNTEEMKKTLLKNIKEKTLITRKHSYRASFNHKW